MAVERYYIAFLTALLGSLVAGCSGDRTDEPVVPYMTGFSISSGALKIEDVLDVLAEAAKSAGLPNSGGAKVGQTIAPNLLLLAVYDTHGPPTSTVWVTARSPVVCMEVATSVWGEESERRSREITAALRAAVEKGSSDVRVSGDRCAREQ